MTSEMVAVGVAEQRTVRWSRLAFRLATALTLAFGLFAEWAYARRGASPLAIGRDLAVGWSFVGVAAFAWWRRPADSSWVLLMAEGFTWFVANLQGAGQPVLLVFGIVFGIVDKAVLVHLSLAFPGGKLGTWPRRAIVLACYTLAVGGALISLVTGGPAYDPYLCPGCTPGPVLSEADRGPLLAVYRAGMLVAGVLAVSALTAIVLRWRAETAAGRRMMAPLWLVAGVCVFLLSGDLAEMIPAQTSSQAAEPLLWIDALAQLALASGFFVSLLRMRLARFAMDRLVDSLRPRLTLPQLQAALARALPDPSLEVVLSAPGARSYLDLDGRPAELPQPKDHPDRAVALVEGPSEPLGAIVYDAALDLEPLQVRMAVAAAASGLEAIRLHMGLYAQVGELEASRSRIQAAAETGRRRIERGIHDGVQQRLVVISMLFSSLNGRVDEAGKEILAQAQVQLQLVRDELREVARDIYPAVLDQRGLKGALESRVGPMGIPVSMEVDVEPCSRAIQATAYSVICEALNNIARHSRASSARIRASRVDGHLAIEVWDDGIGGADLNRGSGLVGLTDQVTARGGRLIVESPAGRGTTLRAELPFE